MATTGPTNIPTDDEFPYWVEVTIDGRTEKLCGPFSSFEEALADIEQSPPGEYVITNRGRIEWPEGPLNRFS